MRCVCFASPLLAIESQGPRIAHLLASSIYRAVTFWALQNLETTLLRFLPRKVKDKIHRAMNDGVDEVFGKVSQEVRRLRMLLSAAYA